MSYASVGFWGFLVVTLVGVVALPQRWRVPWLIVSSLWFYAVHDPVRLIWLGGIIILTLGAMRFGDKAHPWRLPAGVIAALVLMLAWAKFGDAIGLADPHPPPGLSFVTFTAIALLAEHARGAKPIGGAAGVLHLAWFPKLLAGPIERPQALVPQFAQIGLAPSWGLLGFSWVLVGLVKKLVIADNLAPVVDAAFAIPDYAPPIELLIAVYFFAFQIYCDFSGYADIAIGLSLLVGLRLGQNFDRPYLAPTVTEFWGSRWHISLGRWFRDYVFIPLGGSHGGQFRRLVNLMMVFVLSGLWHAGLGYGVGWGFLIWGALNGTYVCIETYLPKPRLQIARICGAVVTFHLILVTWVFFRAADITDAMTILHRVFSALPDIFGLSLSYLASPAQITGAVLIAGILGVELVTRDSPLAERLVRFALPVRWAGWYALIGLLLLVGRWQDTVFIYAAF